MHLMSISDYNEITSRILRLTQFGVVSSRICFIGKADFNIQAVNNKVHKH